MPQEENLDCRACIMDFSDNGSYILKLQLKAKVDFGDAKKAVTKMLTDERIFDYFIVQPSESGNMLISFGQVELKERVKKILAEALKSGESSQ